MRKSRDAESTKQVVIDTAKEVFAAQGFAGASLAMVSEKSGISAGLILYHFKSKENLYKVVLETLAKEYYEAISQSATTSDPRDAMQEMLRATFKYWSEESTYNKISTWAYLENRTDFIDEEARLTVDLAEKIRFMQERGGFEGRFSPMVLLCMAIGPIHFWIRHRELLHQAMYADLSLEELNRLFLDQYIELVKKIYLPS
jgi:AcrR family transcriptional regulator